MINSKQKRQKAINALIQRNGPGAIIHLNGQPTPVLSTGIPALDAATGVGGIPKGRLIEIYGDVAVGKTTLALQLCLQAKREKLFTAWVDVEHSLDIRYATRLQAQPDVVLQPSIAEEALAMVHLLLQKRAVQLIIIDSLVALLPQQEEQQQKFGVYQNTLAVLLSQWMPRFTILAAKRQVTVVFINHCYSKFDKSTKLWRDVTIGGRALRCYAGMRIRLSLLKQTSQQQHVKAQIIKNAVGVPLKTAIFQIVYGKGIQYD